MGAIGGEEVGGRIAAALGDEASVDPWVDDPAPGGERVAAAREAGLEAEQRVLSRPSAAAEAEGAGAALRQEGERCRTLASRRRGRRRHRQWHPDGPMPSVSVNSPADA